MITLTIKKILEKNGFLVDGKIWFVREIKDFPPSEGNTYFWSGGTRDLTRDVFAIYDSSVEEMQEREIYFSGTGSGERTEEVKPGATMEFILSAIKKGAKIILAIEDCKDWEREEKIFYIYLVDKKKIKKELEKIFREEIMEIL